jgi:hypothetical protein
MDKKHNFNEPLAFSLLANALLGHKPKVLEDF